ncbi:MmgE/PrpD family protein [Halalkalicoccus sp. GCM10025322]|uniref:MmgE/PrpD family protein n=1 Tax=Halalkalicoccus TaxID=332246 RepID=UPI002F96846F
MSTTSQDLANYVDRISFDDFDDEVIEITSDLLIDTIGCSIGAFTSPPAKSLRKEYLDHRGKTAATVVGTDTDVPVEYAGLINSAMARYLDYNDCYMATEGACHPSDHIMGLLAVAQDVNADGKTLVEAIVTAYEIECLGLDQAPTRPQGFDYTAWGPYSSVTSVGKLLGLSTDEMINAIGIVGASNAPLYITRRGDVSMWKGVAHPYTTHNAIQACQMARSGLTGPRAVFDNEYGFHDVVSPNKLDFNGMPAGDGYRILETGIKYFATGYYIHSPLTGALELVEEHNIDPDEIESVHINIFTRAANALATPEKWNTDQNRETADHSIPYSVAIGIVDGEVTPRQFEQDRLRGSDVHAIMEKVTVTADEELDAYREDNPRHIPSRTTIIVNGIEYTSRINAPLGHADRPMTDEQLESKVRSLCDGLLSNKQVDEAIELTGSLPDLETVDPILETLVI